MSTWFILAQIMGVITICFDFITYQIKDQRKYLLIYSIGSVFWTMMFVFLGLDTAIVDMVPVIIAAAFGILRSMVFWWIFAKKTKKRKIIGKVFLYVALAIGLAAAIISISKVEESIRWIPIVGLFAALAFIVGQYLPSKHYLRLFACTYAIAIMLTQTPLYITQGSMQWNPMGIMIEVAKIISIAVFYALHFSRKYISRKLPALKAEAIALSEQPSENAPQLERLWAKILRYELFVIDKANITDYASIKQNVQAIVDDMNAIPTVDTASPPSSESLTASPI